MPLAQGSGLEDGEATGGAVAGPLAGPGPGAWRRRFANVLLLAGSLAVTFALLEVLARLTRERRGEPIASRYTEFDPLLGWRHRAGALVQFPQGPYQINSHGLRDLERAPEPPANATRVLVLGDSFAEGFSVAFEDSVSQVLEHSLTHPTCGVEVVSAGTVGYSTDQELLLFRGLGESYRPRVVVLFFYYNDILYNARAAVGAAPKPLLKFHGDSYVVTNAPLSPPRVERREAEAWRSEALAWIQERILQGAPRLYGLIASAGSAPRTEVSRPGLELEVYSRTPPRQVQDAWAQTVNILRALQAAALERGARLLVVYVPSKMEVSERDWALTRARYGVDEATWDRARVASLLVEAGRAAGFPVLDPTGALRRQDRLGHEPYHAGGGHWNAVGHAVAAAEVQSFLASAHWLPDCGHSQP